MSALRPVPPRRQAIPFRRDPPSLVAVRSAYRALVRARPEIAGALDRVLKDALLEMTRRGIPYEEPDVFKPIGSEPPAPVCIVRGLSIATSGALEEEQKARKDLLVVRFSRHCQKGTGGYWRHPSGARGTAAYLAVPPIARWTRDTVTQAMAAVRSELRARGAHGPMRIAMSTESGCSPWTRMDLWVRVGDLRASFTLDAGIVHNALPHQVLYALSERMTYVSDELRRAVENARKRDAEASTTGGAG